MRTRLDYHGQATQTFPFDSLSDQKSLIQIRQLLHSCILICIWTMAPVVSSTYFGGPPPFLIPFSSPKEGQCLKIKKTASFQILKETEWEGGRFLVISKKGRLVECSDGRR